MGIRNKLASCLVFTAVLQTAAQDAPQMRGADSQDLRYAPASSGGFCDASGLHLHAESGGKCLTGMGEHTLIRLLRPEQYTGDVPAGRSESPSKAIALLLSLVLPGAGEYYAGSPKRAAVFLGAEAALWTVFYSFRTYGNWRRNDYRLFAAAHAGVQGTGKGYDYYVDLEGYNSLREYNEDMLRQRDLAALYPETAEYNWQWDSGSNRDRYRSLRLSSDRAYSRATIVIAGVVINHIVSSIDAARLVHRQQGSASGAWRFYAAGLPEGGAVVGMWKSF
ncbi:hypothetical protein JW906_08375 [bacterium]|nr:hypothetical protein [bacterium]